MNIRLCVNYIIVKNNKILLFQRGKKDEKEYQKWAIPGGGVEEGEDIETALRREIKEETGCIPMNPNYFKSYYYRYTKNFHIRAIYFYGEIKGTIKLNDENINYREFEIAKGNLRELDIAYNQREVIEDFIYTYEYPKYINRR